MHILMRDLNIFTNNVKLLRVERSESDARSQSSLSDKRDYDNDHVRSVSYLYSKKF